MLGAFRKMISTLLMAAVVALPAVLIGCEKDEIRTEKTVEVKDQVVGQETVVE